MHISICLGGKTAGQACDHMHILKLCVLGSVFMGLYRADVQGVCVCGGEPQRNMYLNILK